MTFILLLQTYFSQISQAVMRQLLQELGMAPTFCSPLFATRGAPQNLFRAFVRFIFVLCFWPTILEKTLSHPKIRSAALT